MADTSPTRAFGAVFEKAGCQRLETPILQPADVFLDRSGDAIRRRLYMLTDPGGREFCLRPELTIPIARAVIDQGLAPVRVWSEGRIFRYGGEEGGEFTQCGVEFFGGADAIADDAEVFALIAEACAPGAGRKVRLGDLGILHAVLEAVDLPASWRARLRRHFWHAEVFQDLLARLKGAARPVEDENAGLLASIAELSPAEATRAVHDILKLANIRPVGGRSVEEITARFLEKAQDAQQDVTAPEVAEALEAFLTLDVSAERAPEELAGLARRFGLDLGPALEELHKRHKALAAGGLSLKSASFSAAFGRELEYYTGFVFEIHDGGVKVAGGGRYDGLMEQLGAGGPMTAVGGALWPGRIVRRMGP